MTNTPGPEPRRLPFTLMVLAGLLALKATLLLSVMVGANVDRLRPVLGLSQTPELLDAVRSSPWSSGVLLAAAALLLVSAVGMLGRRRTGWLLAMVLTGLFVAIDIYGYLNGGANHIWMGLNILTVFYLNQSDVREVVGAAVPAASGEGVPA